jgi:NADH:ubiquinone oxidoreductase subunit 6 (subunit J)
MDLVPRFNDALVLLGFALFLFKLFAFIDACTRRKDAYVAADKQTKPFWLIILGLFTFTDYFFGFNVVSILPIIGLIAAIVYMVDVRQKLRDVSGGGRRDKGNNTGPYGPW